MRIPKKMLHDTVQEVRHMLKAERYFLETHQERHYKTYINKREKVSELIKEIDKKELQN